MVELTAGAYVRTSGMDRTSIATQLRRIKAFIPTIQERLGMESRQTVKIELGHVYQDTRQSGRDYDRPGYQHLKRDARAGKLDILFVWAMDRLARAEDPLDTLIELRFFREHGVRVFAEVDGIEGTSDTDIGMLQVLMVSLQARKERHDIYRRTLAGRVAYADRGMWGLGGLIPYGWQQDDENRLVVNQAEAEVVGLIFDWATQGLSYAEIAYRLNRRDVEPPALRSGRPSSRWHDSTIMRILGSEMYVGKGYSVYLRDDGSGEGRTITIPAPAIVDAETFNRSQGEVRARNRRPAQVKHFYLLQGMLACSDCRHNFSCTYDQAPGYAVRRYYICDGRRRWRRYQMPTPCPMPWLKAEVVEPPIWQNVMDTIARPDVLLAATAESDGVELAQIERHIQAIETRLNENQRAEERLASEWARGKLSQGAISAALAEVSAEREVLRRELREHEQRRLAHGQRDQFYDYLVSLQALNFEALANEERQGFVRDLVDRIEVAHLKECEVCISVYYCPLDLLIGHAPTLPAPWPSQSWAVPSEFILNW